MRTVRLPVTTDETTVRDRCTDAVFERGQNYRDDGRIRQLDRVGDLVTARVQGSELYDVRVHLDEANLEAHCTCPYDGPGDCKHLVAVLLDVADGVPDDAERVEPVLADVPAEDLRAFVREALAERPDLRERFLARFGEPPEKDAEAYRAAVDGLFEDHIGDSPVVVAAIDFSRFEDLAETYRERGAYEQAAAVYRGLAEGIEANMNLVDAAYDHFTGTFQAALEGYVACLVSADLDEEAYEDHRSYLARRAAEAVDYLAGQYREALEELDAELGGV